MKIRFVPETIYHYSFREHPFPEYIEREMDFLPPMDIAIRDVTSEKGDPFFALLDKYSTHAIQFMAGINGFKDYGWRGDWTVIETMEKDDFMDELWDWAIGYDWKIIKRFYDPNVNAYYCIVELDKGGYED